MRTAASMLIAALLGVAALSYASPALCQAPPAQEPASDPAEPEPPPTPEEAQQEIMAAARPRPEEGEPSSGEPSDRPAENPDAAETGDVPPEGVFGARPDFEPEGRDPDGDSEEGPKPPGSDWVEPGADDAERAAQAARERLERLQPRGVPGLPEGFVLRPPEVEPEPPEPPWLELADHAFGFALEMSLPPDDDVAALVEVGAFGSSPRAWGGSIWASFEIFSALWIGGQLGFRARDWLRLDPDALSASAFSSDAMVVVSFPFVLGRSLVVRPHVAAGVLFGGLTFDAPTQFAVGFRFRVAVDASVYISRPVRAVLRVGWGQGDLTGLTAFDLSLSMAGPFVGLGIEVRR